MSIWFYLFLIVLCLSIFLILKILIMKQEIKNIGNSLLSLIKTDTNNLITISTNDAGLKKLANVLNKSLKNLRTLELEYKQGNKKLQSFITNISHDLRTPLTTVRGYVDLLKEENLNIKQQEYLEIVQKKVEDLIHLTDQLFDFFKILDVEQEIKKEPICLNTVLENSLVSFYTFFQKKNINPKVSICKEKVTRMLNENVLKRIFENILSNAIKYSDSDFEIKMSYDGVIEFSNKTSELDPISVEKIFDRYYTIQNAKKATGIGLSIAKELVNLSGGKILAEYKNSVLKIKIFFYESN